jgi:predicted nucleic acid-binding protein
VALSHLIDTSVLKRLVNPAVRRRVETLARTGALGRATICDLEVGFSARNGAEWDQLVGSLDAFAVVQTTDRHVNRALQVQRALADRSQRGRKIPDLLIAAAAEDLGISVLHYDADFDLIATTTRQRCEWVVAPGSIS